MRIGAVVFPTDTLPPPAEIGRTVEEAGFESLWFPEHSHIPVERASPQGGDPDAPPLPEFYRRTYDQFVALATVAATTTTLRIGTAVCLLAQRDPIWVAKTTATLDHLSGGRLEFGVGFGWNREEMQHHGHDFATRRGRLHDYVGAVRALWSDDPVAYTSDHVTFAASWAQPKPVQQPHPAIHLGADVGPKTAAAIAASYDGWMPIGTRFDLAHGRRLIDDACEAIGRDPDTVTTTVFAAPTHLGQLEQLAERRIDRALLALPQTSADDLIDAITTWPTRLGTHQ